MTSDAYTVSQRDPRHQCLIYDGAPSRYLDHLGQSLIDKLNTNHRCLYLNSPAMVAGMRSRLVAIGLDLPTVLERGGLILTSDQEHLMNGKFDVDRMIMLLKDALQQALADGYSGLWAAGDMTWEFGSERNLTKLLEYERRLDQFMQQNPALSGICQYHCDTLPPDAAQTALETHPALYVNATLSRLNSGYRRA
ncbi:MAG TPA: MEDS domain-containing protein [Bryobacteraceae bacterium]|nr:MEDS domain-containing protein [Bryobacteraceae bacterium]